MSRFIPLTLAALSLMLSLSPAAPARAATQCAIHFTVEVTQGVGLIRPGAILNGVAEYTEVGRSFRQEGGSTAHLAVGEMRLGDDIHGPIWTLITSANSPSSDMVGVYARDIEGFSFAGRDFAGPMALTLFGRAGTRAAAVPPTTQSDWDSLDLRRAFALHAEGADMLAGDVTNLRFECL